MGLVIFAKRGFLGNHFPHLVRGDTILRLSGEVRGAQIAEWLGVPVNPPRRSEADTCVFVKGFRKEWALPHDVVDFSDEKIDALATWLRAHPEVRVLAHTRHAEATLAAHIPNPVIYLPQQHLNWEDAPPEWPATFTAGYIGRPSPLSVRITDALRAQLEPLGIPFDVAYTWQTREDAIAFYQRIHVLIVGGAPELDQTRWQITPAKLINAAAFGKPSLSVRYDGYAEWDGYYVPLETLADAVAPLVRWRDDPLAYQQESNRLRTAAAQYHIRRIAARYQELAG